MKILERIRIPTDNVNDDEVIIKNIYISANEKVEKKTLLLDYETSKANFELESEYAGYVTLLCQEGERIKVNQEIIIITDEKNYEHELVEKKTKITKSQTFSKKAEQKIKELKIDKKHFIKHNLVTEKNVLDYLSNQDVKNVSKKISLTPKKTVEIESLSNFERNGLISSVSKSFDSSSIDTDTVYSNKEFKGSLAILIAKVVSELLIDDNYMHLNSYIDNSIIHVYNEVNFGFALNLGSGLKIGVVKNCNSLGLKDIEESMINLIDKYIDEKMDLDDLTGHTIVLTDLTDQNIDTFTPLITNKNTLMIGLAGEKNNKQNIIISFDHRVTDGLEISKFLNKIIHEMNTQFPNFIQNYSCHLCLKTIAEDFELNNRGLIKVLDHNKFEKYVCINCLQGW